jgi:hypothetical protein
MNKEHYYNVPSATPMTKQAAYKKAIARFGVDRSTARQSMDGITWQGQHGATHYAAWPELPKAAK